MKTSICSILLIWFSASCSTYIDNWHNQLDEDTKNMASGRASRPSNEDKFGIYRSKNSSMMNRPENLPITSSQTKNLGPQIKRQYQSLDQARKRFTSSDLQDNEDNASLWSANGKTTYLFSGTKKRGNGDIITIYVQKKLKDEITSELQKATPELAMIGNKVEKDPPKNEKEKNNEAANPKDSGEPEVYDRISSVIIEEITQDHLLLKGQKQILFNGRKKTVELQALVNRKDIKTDDSVESAVFLENAIAVIR